jgi:DNA polymerase-3 subunit delta'
MLFSDIIGHENIKKSLAGTIKNDRAGHAYLFFGPEGSGKLPMAIAFATYLLCTSRNDHDACNSCAGCNKSKKLIHPDLHFSFPVNKTRKKDKDHQTSDDFMDDWRAFILSNPYGTIDEWYDFIELENKQGIIGIDESRLILTRLGFKPFESDSKAVIIWEADKMNGPAANTLLKIIEEPPPGTLFILTAENPDTIIPTIRSRCINLKSPGIGFEALALALHERHGLDMTKAGDIARIAGGSYSRALKLINSEGEDDPDFLAFRDLLRAAYSKDYKWMTRLCESFSSSNREKQKAFLETGLSRIRECFIRHYNEPEILYYPGTAEETDFNNKFSRYIDGSNIISVTEELNNALRDLERNGNGRIIYMDLALKISGLLPRK